MRSSVVPPIRKLWPEHEGRPYVVQILLHLSRSLVRVRKRMPDVVRYEKIGRPSPKTLIERCRVRASIGSDPPYCLHKMISSPFLPSFFVCARCNIREPDGVHGGFKCERSVNKSFEGGGSFVAVGDKTSTRRHWPHKAVFVAARIHTSNVSV